MAHSRKQVALIVETSVVYGRQILDGIARYISTHDRWSVFLDERELDAPPPDWILDWNGDGIICRSMTPTLAAELKRRPISVVDLSDRHGDLGMPRISSDMRAIGRLAAQHLLDRDFKSIAYCGFENEAWCLARMEGVQELVEPISVFRSPWRGLREHTWQEEQQAIADWIDSLPKPLGIVACNDVRGHHVLDACQSLGVAVPEQVAVIGVDNSTTFCNLCDPPLSSVVPNAEQIGFLAAATLDRLMHGEKAQLGSELVAPSGVEIRQSTDSQAIEDPIVAQALRYIRENRNRPFTVDDLVVHTNVSRSNLERRFRDATGRTPREEIQSARLKRVMSLLEDTDWSLARIADAVGYEHQEYLMVQFKREIGQTPTQYRTTKKLSSKD